MLKNIRLSKAASVAIIFGVVYAGVSPAYAQLGQSELVTSDSGDSQLGQSELITPGGSGLSHFKLNKHAFKKFLPSGSDGGMHQSKLITPGSGDYPVTSGSTPIFMNPNQMNTLSGSVSQTGMANDSGMSNGGMMSGASNGGMINNMPNGAMMNNIPNGGMMNNVPNSGMMNNMPNSGMMNNMSNGCTMNNMSNGGTMNNMSNGGMMSNVSNSGMMSNVSNSGMMNTMSNGGMMNTMSNGGMMNTTSNSGMMSNMSNAGMMNTMSNGGMNIMSNGGMPSGNMMSGASSGNLVGGIVGTMLGNSSGQSDPLGGSEKALAAAAAVGMLTQGPKMLGDTLRGMGWDNHFHGRAEGAPYGAFASSNGHLNLGDTPFAPGTLGDAPSGDMVYGTTGGPGGMLGSVTNSITRNADYAANAATRRLVNKMLWH